MLRFMNVFSRENEFICKVAKMLNLCGKNDNTLPSLPNKDDNA